MNHSSSGLLLLTLYLLTAIWMMPLFDGPASDADRVNLAAAASLVESTTFDVSRFEEKDRKFEGVYRVDGKVYPAGPPGFAVASAPIYAIARLALGEAGPGNERARWLVLRLCLSSLPLLLLGIWLFSSEVDAFSLAVMLFATPLFPLSLTYTSGVFVAVLVYLAFRVVFDFDRVMPGRCLTAGLFLGFCMLCDPRAALPAAIIGTGILFTGKRELGTRFGYFLLGVIPFVAAIFAYSWFVLGSATAALPVSGLAVPGFYDLYRAWFSPAAGIFAYAPVLLFSLTAIFTTKSGGSLRFWVKYALMIFALLAAVFWKGEGGDYAVPAPSLSVALLLFLDPLFDGESDDYSSLWRGFFFTVALLMCTVPVATYLFAPTALSYPHNSFWQPLLVTGRDFSPTALGLFGAESAWAALVPAVVVLLVLFLVMRTVRYPARFAAGILAGLLLMGNYMFSVDLEAEKAKPFIDQVSKVTDQ